MRRVAQIGGGKVFGSEAFVVATAFALGDKFRAGGAGAHPVSCPRSRTGEVIGYSTHGWRLAARGEEPAA
jgi:hypothetical protein